MDDFSLFLMCFTFHGSRSNTKIAKEMLKWYGTLWNVEAVCILRLN